MPTISFTVSPAIPLSGQPTTFTAAPTLPPGYGDPTVSWDLDGDGAFGDATGATATATLASAGARAVRAMATYPDGDRAFARATVQVNQGPPPPPVPATTPPRTTLPAAAADATAARADLAAARLALDVLPLSKRMRASTLARKGLTVRFRCGAACVVNGRLTLDAVTAREIGLTRRTGSFVLARGEKAKSRPGTAKIAFRLTKKASRAIRQATGGTLRITLTGNGSQARRTARITLVG